jgi:hypothetical protein
MSDLRSDLIRLAHEDPELRTHILPLLKEAGYKTLFWMEPDEQRKASQTAQKVARMLDYDPTLVSAVALLLLGEVNMHSEASSVDRILAPKSL